MDTTPQYIKMCQMARHELLPNWEAVSGDYVYSDLKKELRVLYFCEHNGDPPEEYTAGIFSMWIPRQDQLQEMIKDYHCHELEAPEPLETEGLLGIASHFIKTRPLRESLDVQHWSMEQLWLAVVMKEKFNKVWNGEDWVSA